MMMAASSLVPPAEQLRQAASAGQADKVRELCKAGTKMDPDLEGRTALHLAAANGHLASVKALLDAGAKINARDAAGYSPLHQAATEGHEEVVALLLKNGCHVDTQDELHGNTALHEAAWKGYSRTVETLCRHRANVYIKNNGGFTPLHLTCQNGHNQSCRSLLLSGCKPDVRNSYGDTPLHTAARYGHAGVLRILISAFCSVSETNKNGDSALHISAAMGRRKLTKILIEAGCDQKVKNNQGETARDIAERKGYKEVVEILDNPPLTLIPVPEKEKLGLKTEKNPSKKREKDSGTSQESSTKEKKEKRKKSKKDQKVHFSPENTKKGNTSPYGCHMYPNLEFFPSIKIKSLPPEPLQKGEQYYADLAGNIKKGPRGLGYMCYCAPFFNHVEKKLDANKNELLKHIDHKSEDLKAKITHLEQRTHDQLFSLNQRMKESLAFERADCSERMDRRLLRERLELQSRQDNSIQSLRTELKNLLPIGSKYTNGYIAPNRTSRTHMQQDAYHLTRSKSEDLLSESGSHQWSTDITSSNVNGTFKNHTDDVNDDVTRRLYTNGGNHGARPKYTVPQSSVTSRLKGKCYGYSTLSRDSRSEGDLTSCYTEATERSSPHKPELFVTTKPKDITPPLRVVESNPLRDRFLPKFQPNHSHNQNVNYYKPHISNSGDLWGSYGAANASLRTGTHPHGMSNNLNARTKYLDNNSNLEVNKYRTSDVPASVENGNAFPSLLPITPYNKLQAKGSEGLPTITSSNSNNRTTLPSQNLLNQTKLHAETEIIKPTTEPDGSSFV